MTTNVPHNVIRSARPSHSLQVNRLSLHGWKSIHSLDDLVFLDVNVLIGQNGAGKSNLISLFRMLGWIADERLQEYTITSGGASSLLYCGASSTPQMSLLLEIDSKAGRSEYFAALYHAAPDILFFGEEAYRFTPIDSPSGDLQSLGSAHRESLLTTQAQPGNTAGFLLESLKKLSVFQFHNTSQTARMRQRWNINDSYRLKEDAANIAPFLKDLSENYNRHYRLIVETIRQIMPFFLDFVLDPVGDAVMLLWRERNSDLVYSAFQASDGMLRIIALVALLLQPEERLPALLILDEPELGLHPFAIGIIAGLIRSVSMHCQILVATQSTTFVDEFDPHEIIVVDRDSSGRSQFRRLDTDSLREWLNEYSISELWEKNVIGGRP